MSTYPKSPFNSDFDISLLMKLDERSAVTQFEIQNIQKILEWLCTSPKLSSYRINTLKTSTEEVLKLLQCQIEKIFGLKNTVKIEHHPSLQNVIILYNTTEISEPFEFHEKEVIIDAICGAAILRGAHIYAPGILGMLSGIRINDRVSIYADVSRKCRRGYAKLYNGKKIFIGNGIARMDRNDLFISNKSTGVAVEVTTTTSNCPPIGDDFLSPLGYGLLQNLPSILCVYVLNPQPNEIVLDMCASPGNKTTHIAALMLNKGRLVAIDKTKNKVDMLRRRCADFGVTIAEVHQADSTKFAGFAPETFDRILLDAPCSALGKRPQLLNSTTEKVLRSYVPLQRKLFENAINLLKIGGALVYSTCTVTLAENEGMVQWALGKFPNLRLAPAQPTMGSRGMDCRNMSKDDLLKLQRFGPNDDVDSVGFFIAKFQKI